MLSKLNDKQPLASQDLQFQIATVTPHALQTKSLLIYTELKFALHNPPAESMATAPFKK